MRSKAFFPDAELEEQMAQVVVITGASAGVGRATARAFAARGASIGLIARSEHADEVLSLVARARERVLEEPASR